MADTRNQPKKQDEDKITLDKSVLEKLGEAANKLNKQRASLEAARKKRDEIKEKLDDAKNAESTEQGKVDEAQRELNELLPSLPEELQNLFSSPQPEAKPQRGKTGEDLNPAILQAIQTHADETGWIKSSVLLAEVAKVVSVGTQTIRLAIAKMEESKTLIAEGKLKAKKLRLAK